MMRSLPSNPTAFTRRRDNLRRPTYAADALLNSIPQAVIATDLDGVIVFWNRAAEELYGMKASAVIGQPLPDVMPADESSTDPSPVRDEAGNIVGYVTVSTAAEPIGEQTDAKQSRQGEVQLHEAQKAAGIASWAWHIESDAIEGSGELMEILGLDPANELTLKELLTRYIHPEDRERLAEALERARVEDLLIDSEQRLRTPDGIERVLRIHGQRVLNQQSHVVRIAGVVQDVTERRRLENRLLQAERVSSIGRLAASVAHEFNNVLMGIQPFVDLLTRKAGSDPTVKLAAPRIADAVARGKRITQEILRFTRIAEPSRAVVNVADWLQAFEPELEQLAGPGVTVSVKADPSLAMLADAHQLRQVFANLVVNAHHAMPHGGRLEVRAVADTMRNGNDRPVDAVHFTICDTGVGMPKETLRYIFEPLFTTKKMSGTGLGLAVASQVVQQHEGHIYAESALGEGTTFHIVIPAASETAAATVTREPAPRSRHTLRAGLHIAMVEDDDSVGTGLAALLDFEGISVDWIRLGAEAVARIAARLPDAVIFDLGLPDVDGIKLYEEIATRWPDLPVLFSTSHGDENVLKNHVVGKHVGYLQKPYETDALLGALEALLG
jgi:PAS domain S-box-containing protein